MIPLGQLQRCFAGAIPAVVCTRSGAGEPNVTYLSKVELVDDDRVALSNQFLSKTSTNLAEHPRASVLVLDPVNLDEYRLTLVYERTERRGRVFEQLRRDVDAIAAITGMQDVFRLRAADIYRVVDVELVPANQRADGTSATADAGPPAAVTATTPGLDRLAELSGRISRCADLDTLVRVTVDGLAELLGYEHTSMLLLDEQGERLFTIASRGFEAEGVGSEVPLGEGVVGRAAAQCAPVRVGNLLQMAKYSRSVRRSFEATGEIAPGQEVPVPGLTNADSRLAVPALALGQLVGVLVTESRRPVAFTDADEAALSMVASIVAVALEAVRAEERVAAATAAAPAAARPAMTGRTTRVRFFDVDGSTFLDGDYLIKGVAGRILWSLLGQYEREGRTAFTNREVRLDPTLALPDFRDNLESRLIMLKRRLEERDAPMRITKTGRGRFELTVTTGLVLEAVGEPTAS